MIAPSSDGLAVWGIADVIPFTRQEKWLFPRVSNGMHEMEKWETLFFRARQNPYAVRSKEFLKLTEKLNVYAGLQKEDHQEEGCETT
jgi:hypothetical protein